MEQSFIVKWTWNSQILLHHLFKIIFFYHPSICSTKSALNGEQVWYRKNLLLLYRTRQHYWMGNHLLPNGAKALETCDASGFRGLGIIKTIETNELQCCLDGLKWVLHINVLGDNTFPFRHKSIHHYRETFPSFVHVMQIFRSYMTDNIGNTNDAPDHPNYCQ